jgi:hypothetical protein
LTYLVLSLVVSARELRASRTPRVLFDVGILGNRRHRRVNYRRRWRFISGRVGCHLDHSGSFLAETCDALANFPDVTNARGGSRPI